MSAIKQRLYAYFVERDIRVKNHYEGYIISNSEFHKQNRWKSYQFLLKLRKYYQSGEHGTFPTAPRSYIPRFSEDMNRDNRDDYQRIKQSNYFDEKWYYENYPDVRESGMDAAAHYLNIGWKEFRKPGPSFSTLLYLNRYQDANEMQINPLLHYEIYGKIDKRVSSYQKLYQSIVSELRIIENSVFWDEKWYQRKYLKENLTKELPIVHYYCLGCYLGMDPGPVFSHEIYEKDFPDVKRNPVPHLLHYELQKKSGGRGYINAATGFYQNKDLQILIMTGMYQVLERVVKSGTNQKRVLLISHLMNLTGAPKVLLNMALALKKNGYDPVIATLKQGELSRVAEEEDIPVVVLSAFEDEKLAKNIVSFANLFEVIVFNTVESMRIAHILKYTKAYKIAWLHEGNETLNKISKKQILRINGMNRIFTCAEYCNQFFEPYLEEKKNMEVLHYGVNGDEIRGLAKGVVYEETEKTIFIIIGTIGFRKGHDILLRAISMLPEDILEKSEFWFVGSVIDEEVGCMLHDILDTYDNVKDFGQVSNKRVIELLARADVLLCPSIDDPMPVVITEAMILEKPVLTTTHVGTSRFIQDKVNGFLIEDVCEEKVADYISYIVEQGDALREVGRNGYHIFQKYLSNEAFEHRVREIFDEAVPPKAEEEKEIHIISNQVYFYDVIISADGFDFIFSCDKDNELYLFSEGAFYNEITYDEEKWLDLNEYFAEKEQRLAIVHVRKSCILDFSAIISSCVYDTMEVRFGEYCWSTLQELSNRYDICIALEQNVIKIRNKKEFLGSVMSDPKVSKADKDLLKSIQAIRNRPYTIYCETRDNRNDNAYQLFLLDLMTNPNAYFITTQTSYDMEEDEHIKEHLLILNSKKAKNYMLHSKMIVVSWFAVPIYGYERMRLFYPFLNIQYVFVPHGISYDKNSYYLNRSVWGHYKATFVASTLEKEYFEKCNGYKNVYVLGYPRMDKWFDCDVEPQQVFLFPTWRTNVSEQYIDLILELCRYISQNLPNMEIIYAAHPSIDEEIYLSIAAKIAEISRQIVVIHSKERKVFNQYFASAKFLITDYSSVAYDFAYKRDSAAIYYEPFAKLDANYQMRHTFEDNHCGLKAENLEALEQILRGNYDKKYLEERVNAFFAYRDGKNTQRVSDAIKGL